MTDLTNTILANTVLASVSWARTPTADQTVFQFGVHDRLGREIGIEVTLIEAAVGTVGLHGGQILFSYRTQTLRNGKRHQAQHSGPRFFAAADRDAAAEKAVAAARKRAESPSARLKA